MQPPLVTPRVRLVFVAVVALLAAQSLFIHRFDEPYPAIVMPSFRGSGGYRDGRVEVTRYEVVFLAEGEEFSFHPKTLLEQFPDSHHGALAETSLRPRNEAPRPFSKRSWLHRFRDAIFPGYAASRTSRDSPANIASLQDWLRGRARDLVPGRHVSRVEIRWFRVVFSVDGGRLETDREPTGTLVVPLDGDAR